MKIKSKIVLFVCAFVLIFSVLSVSCFAYVPSIQAGESYVFASFVLTEDVNGEPLDFDASGDITVRIDGYDYFNFTVVDRSVHISGLLYEYIFSYDFNDSGAWTWVRSDYHGNYVFLDSLEFTVASISQDIYPYFINWLSDNVYLVSSDSFYDDLYTSISDGVFGVGAQLTSEQVMTLTLISTVLSYAFILLPLLLVIGFVLRCFRL